MNQPKVKYSLSNWDLVTVNPNYKTWNWKDMFCFWGVNIQSVIAFSLIGSKIDTNESLPIPIIPNCNSSPSLFVTEILSSIIFSNK